MNLLPSWPESLPRVLRPLATIETPRMSPLKEAEFAYREVARRERLRQQQHRCSGTTGTWTECMWINSADYSAFASSSSEGSLLAGVNDQPYLNPPLLLNRLGKGRAFSLFAKGVFSTTSTPTIIFQLRLGTTSGSAYLSGTSIGVTAAITTQSGVTNKYWDLRFDFGVYTPGIGSTNCTLSGAGFVASPGGFASPFIYALEPTTPDTATWTSTIDGSLTQYLNLSVTWSASSSSNTITAKQLALLGLN